MTVKHADKTITRQVLVYVADDGKEFEEKYMCEQYERNLKARVFESEIKLLKSISMDVPLFDNDGCKAFVWYFVNQKKDIDIIYGYYSAIYVNNNINLCEQNLTYPCWVGIIVEEDWVNGFYPLNEYMDLYNKFINRFINVL